MTPQLRDALTSVNVHVSQVQAYALQEGIALERQRVINLLTAEQKTYKRGPAFSYPQALQNLIQKVAGE